LVEGATTFALEQPAQFRLMAIRYGPWQWMALAARAAATTLKATVSEVTVQAAAPGIARITAIIVGANTTIGVASSLQNRHGPMSHLTRQRISISKPLANKKTPTPSNHGQHLQK